MTLEGWVEYKRVFKEKKSVLSLKVKRRKGIKPQELKDIQRLLSDADLRRNVRLVTIGELEQQFNFWIN